MGKHRDTENRTSQQDKSRDAKHADIHEIEGFRAGNTDPSKRGLGNAEGNQNNR